MLESGEAVKRYPECAPGVLGFCERCYRVRWLAVDYETGMPGNKAFPYGVCRSCDRECPRPSACTCPVGSDPVDCPNG